MALLERLRIREVIENWAVWRDRGDWERLQTAWHPDGTMVATFFAGPAEAFIDLLRKSWSGGAIILHHLGGSEIEIAGARAVAQSKVTIRSRSPVDGVPCDITCSGRFYDFFERRHGGWAIARRQLIYEKDRLNLVDGSARLALDPELLSRFPEGYRHLAYAQTRRGLTVARDLPGLGGPAVERLYARGTAWLAGGGLAPD